MASRITTTTVLLHDPEYLESIRRYGQKVTLGEGASQSVSLKLTALEVR